MPDFLAWFFERLGWLPHRYRGWAQPKNGSVRVIRNGAGPLIYSPGEARWLAAEMLLAARDAERSSRKQAETVECPYCEGTGRDLGRERPCSDPNGCKGSGRLPPLNKQAGRGD